MGKKLVNRRVNKRLHKYYRFYNVDIWGRLAVKQKYNIITRAFVEQWKNKFDNYNGGDLFMKTALKSIANLNRGDVSRFFLYSLLRKKYIKRKEARKLSFRGNLVKNRKLISLFYGGGRIRKKTFRRYGRMLKTGVSFVSVLESRIDVLIFRANFVDTIYQARKFVVNRFVRVKGHTSINNPGYLVKTFVPILLRNDYWKLMRKRLFERMLEIRIINFPLYLFINFSIMLFFKMKDINPTFITYPFWEEGMNLNVFRHIFRLL